MKDSQVLQKEDSTEFWKVLKAIPFFVVISVYLHVSEFSVNNP